MGDTSADNTARGSRLSSRKIVDWSRLKEIVADALEKPTEERTTFIETACGTDDLLCSEAKALVRASQTSEPAAQLLHPRVDSFVGLGGPNTSALAGRRFGKYTAIRLLGEGGMAAVYLAKQDGVDRPVALKLLRASSLGYDAKRRFVQEVTAQSRIEYPGVASIIDAGIADDPSLPGAQGIRYIAMEYVDGPPLTVWSERKRLSLLDRLRLLADVADAVHAAHQRGIIHRDLKPANVLVIDDGGYGRPKVLDFGIARVLREPEGSRHFTAAAPFHTSRTTVGVMLGTIGYMSPEQARGDAAADLRSDVWALGVLLHELVTGRMPVPVSELSIPEAIRRLADADVTPASIGDISTDQSGGDLRAILTTALANEPQKRYASAEALANDIRRLLRDEPVLARLPTRTYLVRKFIRRHRSAAVAGAMVVAALVIGAAAATISAVREASARRAAVVSAEAATAARQEAERSLALAEAETRRSAAARNFLSRVLESADLDNAGSSRNATLLDSIRAAEPMLAEHVNGDLLVESEIRLTFARALRSLGEPDAADAQYEKAILAARQSLDQPGKLAPPRSWPLELELERAGFLANENRIDAARPLYTAAAAEIQALPMDVHLPRLRLEADKTLAALVAGEGDPSKAADLWLGALAAGEPMIDAASQDGITPEEFATMQNNAGTALLEAGRIDEAIALLGKTIDYRRKRYGPVHPVTLHAVENLGHAFDGAGRLDEAETLATGLVADATKALGPDHPTVTGGRALLISVLTQRQDQNSLERALSLEADNIAALEHRGAAATPDMAIALNNRAVTLNYLKRYQEAVNFDERAIAIGTATLGEDHPIVLSARGNLGQALLDLGQREAGAEQIRKVFEARRRVLGDDHQSTAITRNNLAMIAVEAKDSAASVESVKELKACVDIAERQRWNAVTPIFRRNLGRALLICGRLDEAEAALRRAYEESAAVSAEHQRKAAGYLAEVFESRGQQAEAAEWRAKATQAQ